MGLKNLISALLPRAYHEQVLGDLQERGLRVGDIVSVLPRVWWSHARRSLAVPNLAGASKEILQRRTQHLKNSQMGWGLFWFSVSTSSTFLDPDASRVERWFWAGLGLALLTAFAVSRFCRPARKSETAVQSLRHLLSQQQESARFGSPYFLAVFSTARLIQVYFDGPALHLLKFIGIASCFAYGQYRARRLQKEIESLA